MGQKTRYIGKPEGDSRDLGILVFPALPDCTGHVRPAPDGLPWKKACAECAYRHDYDMAGNPLPSDPDLDEITADNHFYCVHRSDGNFTRLCACYAALHPEKAIKLEPTP